MVRIRRGGYVVVAWVGDHPPRHVHVYRDGRLILKFDLDAGIVLQGRHSAPIIALIRRLQREGRL